MLREEKYCPSLSLGGASVEALKAGCPPFSMHFSPGTGGLCFQSGHLLLGPSGYLQNTCLWDSQRLEASLEEKAQGRPVFSGLLGHD